MTDWGDDPRLTGEHVRTVTGRTGTVTLVGVVHDHPASAYRAREVVAERDPGVLALELPPLALPLFRQYADDGRRLPAFGGEMSAAIRGARTDRIVGIDGMTPGFLRRVARRLRRERVDAWTVRDVAAGLLSATRGAVVCRAAAALGSLASVRVEVDSPAAHGVDRTDDPGRQAAGERRRMGRARSVLEALDPPRSARLLDGAREARMADRLGALCCRGDVVAVVGRDHLEPVADRLRDAESDPES